jgi:hypothetical protein
MTLSSQVPPNYLLVTMSYEQEINIDVFTGVGLKARQEAFRITGEDNTVCVLT